MAYGHDTRYTLGYNVIPGMKLTEAEKRWADRSYEFPHEADEYAAKLSKLRSVGRVVVCVTTNTALHVFRDGKLSGRD